jgi:hypothetical protein
MKVRGLAAGAAAMVLSAAAVFAATKTVDLDAQTVNGAESKCDLNVLSSFPVRIENVVTNKAVGEAFDFTWKSAGPAGFTSSVTAGTTGGVGAKWVWTTNQTVYSYTGNSCDQDICFLKTAGPGGTGGTCSTGCLNDGVALSAVRGTAGAVNLTWAGGTADYTLYRSAIASQITAPANALSTSSNLAATDVPPAGSIFYYRVRGSSCNTLKSCTSNAQCVPASEGICVSRGPFAVPGRSLSATDITVSAASLTSSLITFFSPPKEVFKVTSTAQPGGALETVTNTSSQPVTVATEAYPPGCCPAEPGVDHPVRCGDACVDILDDPNNCGACGNVCGDGTCCTDGVCVSLCDEGQVWCDGACIDVANDSDNCGSCGNECGEGSCCSGGGFCTSMCELGRTYCDGLCMQTDRDPLNCGGCGIVCDAGSVCDGGACLPCGEGESVCDNRCVDLDSDPYNCGACGNECGGCPSGSHGVCGDQQACMCAPGPAGPRPLPNLSTPSAAACPNDNDHPAPVAGHCPAPTHEGPVEGEVPICVVDPGTTIIAPGESQTVCRPGGLLFKEVASEVSVCGDGIPGPDGLCQGGISNVTTGTFMRLVPVEGVELGDAHITPKAVHVLNDPGGDGLMQPGEIVDILVDVINAGPVNVTNATATLIAPAVDLTDDGIDNPIGPTVLNGTAAYGTILGTTPPETCDPVTLNPAAGTTPFKLSIPAGYPGDSTQPINIQFQGTVNGSPFSMSVPLALGIADRCVYSAGTGDYDGIDGLLNPLTDLVPEGDTVPFPGRALNAGNTAPLKMRLLCGGVELRGSDVDPPEIVGLSEATRGEIDIKTITLNDDFVSSDPFFRWNETTRRWIFNMRTTQLGTGVFTLKIKIAGRKDYVTGFELR